jgi:hypothetical protein
MRKGLNKKPLVNLVGFKRNLKKNYAAKMVTSCNFLPRLCRASSIFFACSGDGYLLPVTYCLTRLGLRPALGAIEEIFRSLNSSKKATRS